MTHATRALRALLATALAVLLVAPAGAQTARIGGSLYDALSSASPASQLEVIVTFEGDGPLTTAQTSALRALGVPGLTMRSLPIAGVLATPAQVNEIAGLDGVRSVWLNEELQYENDGATALTGVDRLRADRSFRTAQGLPYSGRGIGVLVNDSGVDGGHPDHRYPDRVVQNVAAQTNLHSLSDLLPITPTEDVINTDIGGGHGTHVAGIIGASGAQSGGQHEGVAPGADIIGYGSGAGLFILDTIGGFDYALTHQLTYNIRVVSNSFGSTSDSGTDFDPAHPTNVATKALADRGVVVVFSAGNSGSGEATITGNFKKAPWIVTVAAGDKGGRLAGFSSRGRPGVGGEVVVDGETFTWADRPTVTAPGVDIISTRASTSALSGLSAERDAELIAPAHLPYYTTLDGTSMACPHVSGIVALMLEADPTLDVYDVRRILQETATNMPGREDWEAGAGYVNAYAAVASVLGRGDYGDTVNLAQPFNSAASLSVSSTPLALTFDPSGVTTATQTFQVPAGLAQVAAHIDVVPTGGEVGNSVGLRLTAPDGTRYTSGITALFAVSYGRDVVVDSPMPGTWTAELYGIQGAALPGDAEGSVTLKAIAGFTGLSDAQDHPARGAIQAAVADRLVDGFADGTFRPDAALTRADLARSLVMGAGVRQGPPVASVFGDVSAELAPFVTAVTARGGALKDRFQRSDGLVRTNGAFQPEGAVSRADLAYSLVQALGLQDEARSFSGSLTVDANGERVAIDDAAAVPAELRGYVQIALDMSLLNAQFRLEQGPFDLQPTLRASFAPAETVTRGGYAVAVTRFFGPYTQTAPDLAPQGVLGSEAAMAAPALAQTVTTDAAFGLEPAAPNPVASSARIAYTLDTDGPARLAVYDVLGREVAVLVDDASVQAGRHEATFQATGLSAGTYVVRLSASGAAETQRLTVVR